MRQLAARRRHPLATAMLLLLALVVTGAAYTAVAPGQADAAPTINDAEGDVDRGQELFLANCATCHGLQAQGGTGGPSLIGVGAASVDFQVATGRMPLAQQAPQAPQKPRVFDDQDTADLAAYVASLAPGPAIPADEYLTVSEDPDDIAAGGELFRINCAMCHNVVGAGGALTQGKYAPSLDGVEPRHIYEALQTGPQSMPVFNDDNITPAEKQQIISYLDHVNTEPSPGGWSLGSIGPVTEGLFVWVGAMVLLIGCAVWLGAKSS
ncbi:cytochrome c [Pseudokineococcus lusitanus]|uniref:Cytochrome bc1 complex cytochrome c subunit n=1 Tax=Pseudokineococcus lusitanus TaxID=763993 RepID=A0A3N1HTJ4_9ACTN|nr:cytochrome c [Pseudokineococcus lusitanus]ROP45712.1 mono/diheme cytochrome c family protein [Pseudokineococcus lusitanus]